jgi:lipopolysaccharide/colanic/teichoic acid biosynthesis glycosyltransferase
MNSELSVTTQSTNGFMGPQIYVYSSSGDNTTEKPDILFNRGCDGDGVTGIDCMGEPTDRGVSCAQTAETRSRLKTKQLNLDFWSSCGVILSNQDICPNGIAHGITKSHRSSLNGSSSLVKRYCDVAGSIFLLIVLFPLFILIAALIKLDSPGPVFFRHHRVGKNGRNFALWKFRSMRMEVPKYEKSPRSADDVRLTRIGRLIRRTSVDEIPQLINVLRGEMSLVGPRPEMPFIVAQYQTLEYERLAVKPGITGLWQISPARAFPIHENLQYDLHYIRNQSFFLDCAIILRTIAAVIHGAGAV